MPLNERESFEDFIANADMEAQEKNAYLEKAAKRPLMQRIGSGVGSFASGTVRGARNAGVDIFDTVTDLGFYAGHAVETQILGRITGEDNEEDANARLANVQAARDRFSNYIKANESDDGVANFAMDMTESLLKFAFIYKSLGKTSLGIYSKVAIAGAGEGFTDSPDRDLLALDGVLRASVEKFAPDRLNEFDRAMDITTGNTAAKQLTKRVMSGVEIGLLAVAGEKAIRGGGQVVKAGVKSLPQPFKEQMVNGFGQLMDKSRAVKEWVKKGDKKQTFDQYMSQRNDTVFNVKQGSMRPEASAQDNLKNAITSEFDSTRRIFSPDDYSATITDYENKLAELAPHIRDEIVSMAKSRGVAAENELAKFARQLGIEEAEMLTERGLRDVLRGQAHNVLFEQQAMNYGMAVNNFRNGLIDETTYLETAKSFHTAFLQRSSQLSAAGRSLRTGQEIPDLLQKVNRELLQSDRKLQDVIRAYDMALENPETLRVVADSMEEIFRINHFVGGSADDIMKAMTRSLKSVDPNASPETLTNQLSKAVGAAYQANLLSGTWTLSQNTFGSAGLMFMRATEGLIETGIGALSRAPGTPTLREGMIQYKAMLEGHWDALLLSGRMAAQGARKLATGEATDGNLLRQRMMDIPEMSAAERDAMFRMNKEDMKALGGGINEAISRNTFASIATGKPVFDIIQMQDIVTKATASRAYMRGRFDTALYVDDAFGLAGLDEKKAHAIVSQMFREGRDVLTPGEVQALGVGKKKAVEITQRMQQWRSQTSQEAADFGVEAAMQTPLTGALKGVQTALQEKLPFGRVVVPFFTTPANIINETLKRAPLIQFGEEGTFGLPVHLDFYTDFNAGGRRRQQAIAKAVSGMALVQMGGMLRQNGMLEPISGDISERRMHDQLFNTNPGSIVVGGKSYPLAALGPIGMLLNYGAALDDFQSIEDRMAHAPEEARNMFGDMLLFSVGSFMSIVRDAPYAKALDDLAGFFDIDPESEMAQQQFENYFGRLAGNMVPYSSLQRQFASNLMEERTRADAFFEYALSSFAPYMNVTAYNAISEQMGTQKGVLARSKVVADDPLMTVLYQEAQLEKVRPLKLDMVFGGEGMNPSVRVRLDDNQWNEYNRIIREDMNLRGALLTEAKSATFKTNAAFGRFDQNYENINAIITSIRKMAQEKLVFKYPDLMYAVSNERKKAIVEDNIRPVPPAGQSAPSLEGLR